MITSDHAFLYLQNGRFYVNRNSQKRLNFQYDRYWKRP